MGKLSPDFPDFHKELSVTARKLLIQHPWPGNVREMLNTLRRAAVWSGGETCSTLGQTAIRFGGRAANRPQCEDTEACPEPRTNTAVR